MAFSVFTALNTPPEQIYQQAVEARHSLSDLGRMIQALKYQAPQLYRELYKKYLALNAKQFEIEYGLRRINKSFAGLGEFGEALSSGVMGFGAGFLNNHIRDIQETTAYVRCLQEEVQKKSEQEAKAACSYHPASTTDWLTEIGKIIAPILIVSIAIFAGQKIWSVIQKRR